MKQSGAIMRSRRLTSLAVDRSAILGLAVGVVLALASADGAGALPPDTGEPPDARPAGAGEAGESEKPDKLRSIFDRIWSYAVLYDNPDNPIIERFAIRGRFQADFPLFYSNQGDYFQAQVRRVRLGVESRFAADLTVHVEMDLNLSCEQGQVCNDDAYNGLTDAYVGWGPSRAFELKIGKASAPFTLDGSTSSNDLLALERNNVSNNIWFPAEYHSGIVASGEPGPWHYLAGVYSSSTGEQFGPFDGGVFLLLSLAYDFSQQLAVRELLLAVNHVYNEEDPDNTSTRDLSHVGSMQLRFHAGRWGLQTDLSGAIGYDTQPDLIALALVPFYDILESLQVVGRYTYVHSFGDNGVRFGRYENALDSGRGDQYNEIYVGLNWLIYGQKFKIQTGFKYTWMDDAANDGGEYRGWGWTTGLRMSW